MRLLVASVLLVALVAQADGPDAGSEQVTFAQLGELATEYGCPDAGPPEVLDGGFRLEDPARAARVDCLLARSSAEVFSWRHLDAGTPAVSSDTLHLVSVIVSAASAVFVGYAANRSARHLGLNPFGK